MCVTHRSPDGTETYVLRALGMKVREIERAGLAKPRQADRRRHASRRSAGRRTADALRRQIAAIRAGCECRIPLHHPRRKHGSDRNDRSRHPHGRPHRNRPARPPPGVGFHKGVRFNLKADHSLSRGPGGRSDEPPEGRQFSANGGESVGVRGPEFRRLVGGVPAAVRLVGSGAATELRLGGRWCGSISRLHRRGGCHAWKTPGVPGAVPPPKQLATARSRSVGLPRHLFDLTLESSAAPDVRAAFPALARFAGFRKPLTLDSLLTRSRQSRHGDPSRSPPFPNPPPRVEKNAGGRWFVGHFNKTTVPHVLLARCLQRFQGCLAQS